MQKTVDCVIDRSLKIDEQEHYRWLLKETNGHIALVLSEQWHLKNCLICKELLRKLGGLDDVEYNRSEQRISEWKIGNGFGERRED